MPSRPEDELGSGDNCQFTRYFVLPYRAPLFAASTHDLRESHESSSDFHFFKVATAGRPKAGILVGKVIVVLQEEAGHDFCNRMP